MILEVFDVEHGACALVTTSNGRRIMIDCGHNARTGWRPGTFLVGAGIPRLDRLFITNYDEDHVSGIRDLFANVWVQALFRNPSVRPSDIRDLKSDEGMGLGIDTLVRSIEGHFTAPAPVDDFGDTHFTCYWNNYDPLFGFVDENNLSLVTFVTCGVHKIIFPGDMEKAGWRRLLQNPAFVNELAGVDVFVASHHGRENGYCEEVMQLCRSISVVVISDKHKGHQTQETVPQYRRHAAGIYFPNGKRHVLTTRRDSSIEFNLSPGEPFRVWINRAAMIAAE